MSPVRPSAPDDVACRASLGLSLAGRGSRALVHGAVRARRGHLSRVARRASLVAWEGPSNHRARPDVAALPVPTFRANALRSLNLARTTPAHDGAGSRACRSRPSHGVTFVRLVGILGVAALACKGSGDA